MSKKSRRARAKTRKTGFNIQSTQAERSKLSELAPTSKVVASPIGSSPTSIRISQHQYVLPELRQIGIIAGALILILIVLTFVLG